jgi:hypothetical protein
MNSEPTYGAAEILVIELGYGSVARFFTEEGKATSPFAAVYRVYSFDELLAIIEYKVLV